jgi:ADP-ribose pyrophosphatase
MNKKLWEHTISSKKIFNGNIIKVFLDNVKLPNDKTATREKVIHPGAVAIVPVNSNMEVILVKQYRHPVEDILIEIPAGKLDAGESPLDCAKRELEEEVGAKNGNLIHLSSFHTTPGFSNEVLHLYLAIGFLKKQNNLDEDEFLEVLEIKLEDSIDMIVKGEIKDAKTIIGIFLAKKYLEDNTCANK